MASAAKPVRSASGFPLVSAALYYRELQNTMEALDFHVIDSIADYLVETFARQATVFFAGNGGSAATASHFACDLGKGTADCDPDGRRFRAIALTDNLPSITAWANDDDFQYIFSEQLKGLANPGDVLFAISGSGDSPNIIRAAEAARDRGMTVIGLTGFRGGRLKPLCKVCLVVPSENMQIIEDVHMSAAHSLYHILSHRLAQRNEASQGIGAD